MDDTGPEVLRKGGSTRYLVLVEVADHQPAVSQREVAERVGVTPQAVSEHLRGLRDEGFVEKSGRGRYEVTNEGVDWLMSRTRELHELVERVSDGVVGRVDVEAAVAGEDVAQGDRVRVEMRDGVLHAFGYAEGDDVSMTAEATSDAKERGLVGITEFEGVLDYEPGEVVVLPVPDVEADADVELELPDTGGLVASSDTEALVALRRVGREPDVRFGVNEALIEASTRGVDSLLVTSKSRMASHVEALREANVRYEVV